MTRPVLYVGREAVGLSLFWLDAIGEPVDLSSGWTFAMSIEQNLASTSVTATVTGNASPTADTRSSGAVPSCTIVFGTGALDSLAVGPGLLRVVATSGGRDREAQVEVEVRT